MKIEGNRPSFKEVMVDQTGQNKLDYLRKCIIRSSTGEAVRLNEAALRQAEQQLSVNPDLSISSLLVVAVLHEQNIRYAGV